jgi:hypothetical protein
MDFSVVVDNTRKALRLLHLYQYSKVAADRESDFSVVVPDPPFCHRKTRKIPGGDRRGGDKNGRFLREKLALLGSGEALFLSGLPREKMGQNAEKPGEGARSGGFRVKKGPFFARKLRRRVLQERERQTAFVRVGPLGLEPRTNRL